MQQNAGRLSLPIRDLKKDNDKTAIFSRFGFEKKICRSLSRGDYPPVENNRSAYGAAITMIAPAKRTIQAYPKLKKPAANDAIIPISLIPLYPAIASAKKTRMVMKTAIPAPCASWTFFTKRSPMITRAVTINAPP